MPNRKAKVLRAFLQYNPLKKTESGSFIIDETGTHPLVYVTPIPTLADLTSANNDLRDKATAAMSGDTELIKARDASEKAWDEIFGKNCDYTDSIANGDVLKIAQAGHKATKTDITHKERPGQAVMKWVKGDYTTKGKIDIECQALAGADLYIAIAAIEPINVDVKSSQFLLQLQGQMGVSISTTRKISLENLQSKEEYFVVAFGYNTAGAGPVSQAGSVVVP